MEYTKGKWYVKDWHTRIEIRCERSVIANLDSSDFTLVEDEANAQLIASAPDMYEACEMTLRHLDDGFANGNLSIKTMLKQALAKAEAL